MSANNDVNNTIRLLNSDDVCGYNNIYPCTNEDLVALFEKVDLKKKDVLSVLGSGDHVFMSFINGAKSVTSFDINKLAQYYYYLRLWTIKYYGTYYPEPYLDMEYIKDLLDKVRVMEPNENRAYDYWRLLVKKIEPYEVGLLFFVGNNYLHISDSDLRKLRERVYYNDVKFHNIDIAGDIKIDDKFDVVFTSNIVDWLSGDEALFRPYRDNLAKLLKKGGSVIASNLGESNRVPVERVTFSEKFDFKKLIDEEADENWNVVGYQYRKK